MSMIEKFNTRADAVNSLLCIGLDTDVSRLSVQDQEQEYPLFAFNRRIIDATHSYAAAYKPNMAFYEAHGETGWHQLRMTIGYLREEHPDIVTICDAKRADIDSTNMGYISGLLDDLNFDAITLHPFLGREAMVPFLNRADKGCIILCRTSNPGAGEFQDLLVNGVPLWLHIARSVAQEWNSRHNCMLVVGATYPAEMQQIRAAIGDMTLLVPGIGAQGGSVKEVMAAGPNSLGKGLIINAGRSIIYADDPVSAARSLRDEINQYRG